MQNNKYAKELPRGCAPRAFAGKMSRMTVYRPGFKVAQAEAGKVTVPASKRNHRRGGCLLRPRKKKWRTADGKGPLFGRVNGFQIDPKSPIRRPTGQQMGLFVVIRL